MSRLLPLLLALLVSCAPVAQLAQPGEQATLTRDGLSLLLSNPGPDALTGDPSRPGDGPALTIDGAALQPDAQAATWCRQTTPARWACNLPTIPAGQRLRVVFVAGEVRDAGVWAYRPGLGARPVIVWLR